MKVKFENSIASLTKF